MIYDIYRIDKRISQAEKNRIDIILTEKETLQIAEM